MAIVNCKGCGAELHDDRETCPHCGEDVVSALEVIAQTSTDDATKELITKVIAHERQHAHDMEQIVYLTQENERLKGEVAELRKPSGRQAGDTTTQRSDSPGRRASDTPVVG